MKHLIFTRFYCIKYGRPSIEHVFYHYPDLLSPGLRRMEQYLIPSLENQTCKDFTLVVMIHSKMVQQRPEIYDEISKLEPSFPMIVIDYEKGHEWVDSLGEDYIIGTRIDNDDCVGKFGVQLTQEQFDPNLDFKFFAFMDGAVLYMKENELRRFISSTWYDNMSSFSIFPSLMTKWNEHKILPIYNHTRLTEHTDAYGIKLIPGVNHVYDYDTKLAWLYMRHDTNVSTDKFYKYGEKLDLNRNMLLDQFGISLEGEING